MLARAALVLLVLALAACRTAGVGSFADMFGGEGEGACADAVEGDDGSAFACDEDGALVACTGRRALTKKGGLNVCTQVEDAGFMLVCTKGPTAQSFEVELLPCAACTSTQALGVVDFDLASCKLPVFPDAGEPLVDDAPSVPEVAEGSDVTEVPEIPGEEETSPVDAGPAPVVEDVPSEFHPCPCEATFRCDEDLDVCVPRDRCADEYECDDGEVCVLDDDEAPICVDAPAPPAPADAGPTAEAPVTARRP